MEYTMPERNATKTYASAKIVRRVQGWWADLVAPCKLTCALVVRNPSGWLMGHSTGRNHWDLPKGKREPGEAPLCAALRECKEETGLDLSEFRDRFVNLGRRPYRHSRRKNMHLFVLDIEQPLDLSSCRCQSLATNRGPVPVPDMDDWAWVPEHRVPSLCRKALRRHLVRRGLIEIAG